MPDGAHSPTKARLPGKAAQGTRVRSRRAQAEPLLVLIDAENVPACLWPRVQEILALVTQGRPMRPQAFFCGDDVGWSQHEEVHLTDGGFAYRAKNSADFMLAFHAGELAARGTIKEVAIVSGDDGLALVAKQLRDAGVAVYAVIPCGSGTYGCKLADAATLALLAPLPADLRTRTAPVVTAPAAVSLAHVTFKTLEHARQAREITLAMAKCKVDTDGWVMMADLGVAVAQSGISLGSKKLGEVLTSAGCFEFGLMAAGQAVRVIAPRPSPAISDASAASEPGAVANGVTSSPEKPQ
ncbi:NYN domain-containing protein [Roseomonas elaeocarpi]|uniref:NYN domain-containing protein n=1 Tax=Roseomonas elaeocarpi TaxID=907779 RepID=A0ABV6JMP9_9PROT